MKDDAADAHAARRARFEELYRRHYGDVLNYARRRAPEAAHDVVADTFLVAWRRFDDVPFDALPWLLAIARKTVANHRRRLATAAAARLHADSPAPAPEAGGDEPIIRALRRLTPADQEILLLVAWEELDHRRGARALGCSPLAFRLRLHRARQRLRAELENLEAARERRHGAAPTAEAEG